MLPIIMAQEVTDENISLLRKLTSEHHKLYINLFDDTLKPKHHLLLRCDTDLLSDAYLPIIGSLSPT